MKINKNRENANEINKNDIDIELNHEIKDEYHYSNSNMSDFMDKINSIQQLNHFVFPEIGTEEIIAQNYCRNEMEENNILPYSEAPEDDMGLSIRGIKLHTELSIEGIGVENYKFPYFVSTPKIGDDLEDLPPLSPMNVLSPLLFSCGGSINHKQSCGGCWKPLYHSKSSTESLLE